MKDYQEWSRQVRAVEVSGPDFNRLLGRIKRRAAARPRLRTAAGLLAVLLIAAALWLGQFGLPGSNNDLLLSYVIDNDSIDGLVLDYVFAK